MRIAIVAIVTVTIVIVAMENDVYIFQVGKLGKNEINFEVFLSSENEETLFRDIITITAEVYDISIDLINANPIDLKNVKVNYVAKEKFTIKNLGLYAIKYS